MPGEQFTWKTTGAATGNVMDFGELSLDPQVTVPEHIHHAHDEAYYVLSGAYRFKVGDEIAEASAGTFVFIPRGTPHTWANVGPEPGRVLFMYTPGGMAGFFKELEPLIPDMMAGMADMAKMEPNVLAKLEEISKRYQYEIVGPPLS
jgi:mannose-6-phosphate isomerase-like protein (cupin superfamily)